MPHASDYEADLFEDSSGEPNDDFTLEGLPDDLGDVKGEMSMFPWL